MPGRSRAPTFERGDVLLDVLKSLVNGDESIVILVAAFLLGCLRYGDAMQCFQHPRGEGERDREEDRVGVDSHAVAARLNRRRTSALCASSILRPSRARRSAPASL